MMKSVESDQPAGIGIDIAEIAPFRSARPSFLEMVFTARELDRCRCSDDPPRALAVAWAAKEAATKAVGGACAVLQWETLGNRIRPVVRRGAPIVEDRWEIQWQERGGDPEFVTVVAQAWRTKETA